MEDKRDEASSSSSTSRRNFPVGLRVLVVDDDPICLMVVEKMLRKCGYEVTTCEHPAVALSMLREKKDEYDVILVDVYMPDINGFELLHMVKEMDLPVVMMSANCDVNVAKIGLERGACYYLVKPVPLKELKNIWQHIIRKRKEDQKDGEVKGSARTHIEQMESIKEGPGSKKTIEKAECASTSKEICSEGKKRMNGSDGDKNGGQGDNVNAQEKKERLVWNTSLHSKFLNALNQIGLDRAAPKKIHELIDEPGLTRANVASHLQKYRMFLKTIRTAPPSKLKKSTLKWLPTQTASNYQDPTGISPLPEPYNPMGPQPPVAGLLEDALLGNSSAQNVCSGNFTNIGVAELTNRLNQISPFSSTMNYSGIHLASSGGSCGMAPNETTGRGGFSNANPGVNMMAEITNKGKMPVELEADCVGNVPVSTEEDNFMLPDLPSWEISWDLNNYLDNRFPNVTQEQDVLRNPTCGASLDTPPSSGADSNNMVLNQAQNETGFLKNFDFDWLFEDEEDKAH